LRPLGETQPVATSVEQLLGLAGQKKAAGEFREALGLLRAVLERDAVNISAQLLMGEILLESHAEADYAQARQLFMRVLESEPSNYRANLGIGKIWLANGVWRQAVEYLQKAVEFAPGAQRGDAKRLLARAYAGKGDMNPATQAADEALKADPTNLDALQTRAEVQLSAADRDPRQLESALKATEDYVGRCDQAVRQAPGNAEALNRLNGGYDLALAALRAYHNNFYELDNRGQRTDRVRPGAEKDVAEILGRIAELYRSQSAVRYTLSEHDATVFLAKAVELQPKDVSCLEKLAEAYARIMDRVQAIETYRRILELEPSHAAALEYLRDAGTAPTTQPATAPSSGGSAGQ
jgi:Tfp pilus assembly protein PilF